MDIVYLCSVGCACIYSIRSGTAQIVPCFAVSLGYLFFLELLYRPYSAAWLREWYAVAVGGYMALRVLAVAEAFLLHSYGHPRRRLLAISTIMLALMCAAIMTWQISGPTALLSAIQARRVIVVGLFAFLLIYCLLRWSMGEWRQSFASRHVLTQLMLQSVLAASSLLAIAAPEHWWWIIDPTSYALRSIVLVGWAAFAIPGPPHVHVTVQLPVVTR